MFDRSRIEISKTTVEANLQFLRSLLSQETKLCAVVKGNAYGHGIDVYPVLLQELGIKDFAVSSAEEAFQLHGQLAPDCHIMVMARPPQGGLSWLIEKGVSFYVNSFSLMSNIMKEARTLKKQAQVHLELETGMYRTGMLPSELEQAVTFANSHPGEVKVIGICTHLAGAEERINTPRLERQIEKFSTLAQESCGQLGAQVLRHVACSAALINYPQVHFEMVRVGVMLYGFWSTLEVYEHYATQYPHQEDPLKQVMTWKTHVQSLKAVPQGHEIGYGKSYQSTRDMQIAILPVGYADGFSRSLSNVGYVLIHGKRAPVVGTVNMNMMSVDVTDLEDVEVGDEVVLTGRQKGEHLGVTSFSDMASTLNYESLVRLASGIPRVVV